MPEHPAGGSSPLALLTGAGGGLGAAIARRLAASGTGVACVDVDGHAVEATVASLSGYGVPCAGFVADISNPNGVDELHRAVGDTLGPVSHVLNVAGILHRGGLGNTDFDMWKRVLDVNVTGPFLLVQAFADQLRAAPYGRVINCASIGGTTGYPFTAYAASKAALSNMTGSLLFDFWGSDVTVNAVAPGAMRTPMLDASAESAMIGKTPSGKIVTADDVAAVFEFLASAASSGINGVTITVDGGATAQFSYT
ncbi:dehydrogenase [Rhodococcoides trifolii]|uniref:Dehydrogenase n=1 Tax=Rhodococcoides trifolii TaxID=908250 RepID=A0A917G956_9NOCA|nr:SDR family oxidoreductase [Rhodococcus trifolii]GGG29938.1 dehydrogenase [Rhodococcus trifolii]